VSRSSSDYLVETSSTEFGKEVAKLSKASWKTDGLVFTFRLLLNGWEMIGLASSRSSTEISPPTFGCVGNITELCAAAVNMACIKEMSVTGASVLVYRHSQTSVTVITIFFHSSTIFLSFITVNTSVIKASHISDLQFH
jgi:hypothetical protein